MRRARARCGWGPRRGGNDETRRRAALALAAALLVGMALSGVSSAVAAWGGGQGQATATSDLAGPEPDGTATGTASHVLTDDAAQEEPTPTVSHTVTFDTAGGTTIPSQVVLEGSRASAPEAPARDDDEFMGWYEAASPYDFSRPVLSDVNLVARWRRAARAADETPSTQAGAGAVPESPPPERQGDTGAYPETRGVADAGGDASPAASSVSQSTGDGEPATDAAEPTAVEAAADGASDNTDDFPDAPASDAWDTDASYRRAMEEKARGHETDTDTDWCVTFDCDLCRCCVVHRGPDGQWHFVRGWDCDVGPIQGDGRSQSMHWNHLTRVVSKWQDSGNGMDVNPWKMSMSNIQTDFGWHGTWGTLEDNRAAAGGTAYNTGGGMVVNNGPAKWMYDNCPIGTEVVVFDHVEPK